jgi:hypothetical protein
MGGQASKKELPDDETALKMEVPRHESEEQPQRNRCGG